MSINIVSLVLQYLTPDLIAKIAAALGVDKSLVGKAAAAAVPGLLAGLTSVASTQEGSRKLFETVAQQRPSALEGLGDVIGAPGQSSVADSGMSVLSSLMGGSSVSALGAAVGKFAGLPGTASSSLLGLLTPVVMGALGKQKAASGLDASGLSSLLASQKSNISAALPSGFPDLLGTSVSGVTQAARGTAQTFAENSNRAVAQASGFPGWARWVIPALAILALAWWYLGNRTANVAEQAKTTTTQATESPQGVADAARSPVAQATQGLQNLVVGGVDVGASVQKTFDGLKTALQGVKDVDTAKAALPTFQDATAQLDKLSGLTAQLPAGGKSALAAFIAAARPSLDDLFNKALAIPGVSDVVKSPIDMIKAKLDVLAKA